MTKARDFFRAFFTSLSGRAAQVLKCIFAFEIAPSATILHQPLIEPDDVKWRLAGQDARTVLNCAAQADIVCAFAVCRVGGSKHHETELCSSRDCLGPAVRIELGEYGGNVKLGGVKGDS